VLVIAGVRLVKGAAHCNDAVRPWHLQFEVGVVGDPHKFGVARTPEDGVVRSLKVHHLEDSVWKLLRLPNMTSKSMFPKG
jgi:hypothetical protein